MSTDLNCLTGLLVTKDKPHVITHWRGPAASAWSLACTDDPEGIVDRGIYYSRTASSDENEALVGSLVQMVKSARAVRNVTVISSQAWIVDALNTHLENWKTGGWSRPKKYRTLWKTFARICNEKGITVRGRFLPKEEYNRISEVILLERLLDAAVSQHARNFGHPSGGFGEC